MKNEEKSPCSLLQLKMKIIIAFLLAFLVLLTVGRIGLWRLVSDYFAPVTGKQAVLSFLMGFRFDFYIIVVLAFPWFLLLALPFTGKWQLKTVGMALCVLGACLAQFLVADIVFFSFFNNHIGAEFFTAFTHLGLFAQLAFQTYWFVTFPLLFVLGGGLWLFWRFCNQISYQKPTRFIRKSIVLMVVLALVGLLGVRSHFKLHGRPLSVINSQILGTQQTADLILNGAFTLVDAIKNNHKRKVFFPPEGEAFSVATQSEEVLNSNNPFERRRIAFNHKNKGYNFVVLLMESFDPVILAKHPSAAPHLMEIKENSLYFKNFYSVGNRSLIGVTGLLFSIPYVWGVPTFTQGLGGKNLSRIAQYFNHKGYKTLNVITDHAKNDRAEEMARYAGFNEFYSKKDIPVSHKYPVFNKGFDYEGFEFLLKKINEIKGNFFAYMFTSSTHSPYNIVLLKEYQKYPTDTEEHNFLNRVVYTDAALGNFFTQAAKEPWFDNTVFFILPDHRAVGINRPQEEDKAKQYYKSFLLIYAPKLFAPKTIETNATQEDILPTLVDLLNSEESFSAVGQSLFDADRSKTRYIYSENKDIYILKDGQTSSHFKFLDNISHLSDEEKAALAFNEAVYRRLKTNTFKSK
ncbi:MAG: LTA synthase family protein [Elusimicrobiaceae bacterium]|nr:LTA synthase family protein [Elusimicrobiaceae bacterium]